MVQNLDMISEFILSNCILVYIFVQSVLLSCIYKVKTCYPVFQQQVKPRFQERVLVPPIIYEYRLDIYIIYRGAARNMLGWRHGGEIFMFHKLWG